MTGKNRLRVFCALSVLAGCQPAPDGFVEDAACAACHRQQYADWRGSHHDLAMREATEATVLGDFEDAVFERARFFRRDGRFFVNTEGPDGVPADFEVRHTLGIEPLQQYLLALPGGRLGAFGIAWDTRKRAWFSLYPGERFPAGDPLHWTGWRQDAGTRCIECHTSGFRFDPETEEVSWRAAGIGCQSCHGPGGAHVLRPEEGGLRPPFPDAVSEVESCAACHALRTPLLPEMSPSDSFGDAFRPTLLTPESYHADGQILGEVFEYGSFTGSRMFAKGVRCTDCHNPHGLGLRVRGNALCEQCHHPDAPTNRFPTLTAKDYDSPAHHFHPVGSEGARCANCHMPERTYMVVDPRRDHSFRIPRPDLSAAVGSPDPCTGCHEGMSQEWATRVLAGWYGPTPPSENPGERHYGETLAAGRSGDPGARDDLVRLVRDREQPAIARATAIRLLRSQGAAALPDAFGDPDGIVRAEAAADLGALPPGERSRLGEQLLRDPSRRVRVEAANAVAPFTGELPESVREAFGKAAAEYRAAARSRPATPESLLRLGNFHAAAGDLSEAERRIREALARYPESGDAHVSLALLLAEGGRLEEALPHLERASALLPGNPRVHYNRGLALQQLERREEARIALERAVGLAPETPDFLLALAILHAQEDRWEDALPWAERAADKSPEARTLLDRIRRELAR